MASDAPTIGPRFTFFFIAALLIVHVALALNYARVTPYRTSGFVLRQPAQDIGAPDERQHANYVQHILDGKGIPVFNPKDPNLYESYQAHQPPLYYFLAAGWAKVVGVSDVSQPEGVRIRWLSALLTAVTVLGCFYLCLWGFGSAPLGLVAATFMALLPMFAALGGAISNDPLLFALSTWSLALMCRGAQHGWTIKSLLVTGLLIGLGVITKTTALALVPVLILALVISRTRSAEGAGRVVPAANERSDPVNELPSNPAIENRKSKIENRLLPFLPIFLLGLPWWIRNIQVLGPTYGFDPFAIKAFNDAFVGSPQASTFIEAFGPWDYWINFVGWWTARSFFGAFGYMDIFLAPTTYRLLLALAIALVGGWIVASQQPEWKERWRPQSICLLFLLLIVLSFLRFNLQYFQGQARYLFPALAVIAYGLAAGGLYLTRGRWLLCTAVIGLGFLGLNLYIFSILPDEFARRM